MHHRIAAALRGHAISVLAAAGATAALALSPAPGWAQAAGSSARDAAGAQHKDIDSTAGSTRSRPPASPLPGNAKPSTNGVSRAGAVNGSAGTGSGSATSSGTPPGEKPGVSSGAGSGPGTGSGMGSGGAGGAGSSSTGGAGGVGGSTM